ncbi:MAG: hypothetical protein AAF436_18305, partial [Myxococcota bacterium]
MAGKTRDCIPDWGRARPAFAMLRCAASLFTTKKQFGNNRGLHLSAQAVPVGLPKFGGPMKKVEAIIKPFKLDEVKDA